MRALALLSLLVFPTLASAQMRTGVQEISLQSASPATNQAFGAAVAITPDGSRLAICVPGDGSYGTVRVYVSSGATWTPEATLSNSPMAMVGVAVAFARDGTRLVVGAPTARKAFVWLRTGTSWAIESVLTSTATSDRFGTSVAIDELGDRVVIGAPGTGGGIGAARVFVRSGSAWTEEASLSFPAAVRTDWGASVSITDAGDRVAMGGPYGAAVAVFVRSGVTWTEEQRLTLAGDSGSRFGRSVAVSADGTRLAVGANSSMAALLGGSVHVYVRAGATWSLETVLRAPRVTGSDFGRTVAISRDGSFVACDMLRNVQAFVFARTGTSWSLYAGLAVPGFTTVTLSGSMAMTDDASRLAIGMPEDNIPIASFSAGTARVFHFTTGTAGGGGCVWDTECGSAFCADSVCCDTACGPASGLGDCQTCAGTGICRPIPSGTMCRASYGSCDVSEACDGTNILCPSDALVPAGTMCAPAAGDCDVVDRCDGISPTCLPRFVAGGTECRGAADLCDAPEACTGTSVTCPADVVAAAGTECRAAGATCDPAEVCDGTAMTCPADVAACPDAGIDAAVDVDAAIEIDAAIEVDAAMADAEIVVDAAMPTIDAGHDAGTDAAHGDASANDAAHGSDAGAPPTPASCACRASRANTGAGTWLVLAVLGLARRRRQMAS